MGKLRSAWVAEVSEGKVEEVENLEEQGPAEVGAGPQMDEAELEQVVDREGCCEVEGRSEGFRAVGLEEGGEVRDLGDVENDPEGRLVLFV